MNKLNVIYDVITITINQYFLVSFRQTFFYLYILYYTMSDVVKALRKVEELSRENKKLNEKISYLESNQHMNDKIDKFVEDWFEKNKDTVDIGEVTICGRYKVDLIPDELKKRIYSKMLKIVYALFAPPPIPQISAQIARHAEIELYIFTKRITIT